MKIKIDKIKKETLIFTGLTIFLVLFLFLGYIPQKNSVESLKLKVEKREKRRNKIESILTEQKKKGMKNIEQKLDKAKEFFPLDSSFIIKYISEQAHDLNLNIASLTPQEEKSAKTDSGEVSIDGKKIYMIPITVEIKSNFEIFTEYLRSLTLESPYLIRVRNINLNRAVDSYGIVNVKMELLSYYKSE